MQNKIIELQISIPVSLSNQRLDITLAELFPQYSRTLHQQWIRQGFVKLDNQVITSPKIKVKSDQIIEIRATIDDTTRWEAQNIPLNILYEDASLLIINKPAGLITHPGAGNPNNTLANALLHYAPELATVPRAGIIHRLDKDTSGILVIARNLSSHHKLTQAIKNRSMQREYLAIVSGTLISGGTIETEIGRHPIHRTQMAVINKGKRALTHYRIMERYRLHTLLRVHLETGRTHQIRVHMRHIHHPLIGDPLYGKQQPCIKGLEPSLQQCLQNFPRQALHAEKLSFMHPETNQPSAWQAPLPIDMTNLIQALRRDSHHD